MRLVIDTNVLVSRILKPEGVPAYAVRKAFKSGKILISTQTMEELALIFAKEKFDRYVSMEKRKRFIRSLSRIGEHIAITYPVHACRDPQDDKFLELAVNGEADIIMTGDDDLLMLNPFRNIKILTPSSFLETYANEDLKG